MNPAELDAAISDISTQLERVRALYEQYFMGIERLEPTIPRKNLERGIQVLRKIRFQNTAKRFKFQTIVQRYNSLQQYWNRTCRDIENGTYKKHLQKAERKLAKDADLRSPEEREEDLRERAGQAADAKEQAGNDLAAMLDADIDLEAEMDNALSAFENKPAKPQRPTTTSGLLGQLGSKGDEGKTRARPLTSPGLTLGKAPPLKSGRPPERKSEDPGAEKRSATRPRPTTLRDLKDVPKDVPITEKPKRAPRARPTTLKDLPKEVQAAARPQASGPPPAPSMRPKRPARPMTSPGVKGLGDLGKAKPAAAQPAAKPAAPKPAARPAAQRPAAKRPAGNASLSEDRIKALHASYVDARKKTNASSVSFEKLSKSIRDTEQKLRAKHKGKSVDFDVSIKGGKAILKPRLK